MLSSSARKIQQYLDERGFSFTVRELTQTTRTAADAAAAVGCSVDQIAKSLVFKDKNSGDPILIVASGGNRVDVGKVERVTGHKLGRADGDYVKDRVGFAIGGVPPVGHTAKLLTILDRDLQNHEEIWAAAGTPHALFSLKPNDLQSMTGGIWIDLAETPS